MKHKRFAIVLCFSAGLAYGAETMPKNITPAPLTVFNFDHDAPGKPPAHFTQAVTGEGPEIHWEVQPDAKAPSSPNSLVQNGKANPGDNFALLLLNDVTMEHGEIAVRFKALGGEEDQVMGIVYRYQNPQNYYVITGNSREDNCALWQIKKGVAKELDSQDVIISPLMWHELRITFIQKSYTALIDGEAVLGGKDSHVKGAGQVGLWTKSDSAMAFDDFRVSQ